MRLSHLIETHVSAQLIHHRRSTKEGENISYDMEELNLNTQTHFGKSELDDDSTAEDVEPSKVKADKTFPIDQGTLSIHKSWTLERDKEVWYCTQTYWGTKVITLVKKPVTLTLFG